EAGFPPGVVNLVQGRGEVAGAALVDHPGVDLISFTGSSDVGALVGAACARRHANVSLEMGGKNAQIVLADADLDLALDGVLWGAFGTTGQRCTATSRLVLQDGVHDEFLTRLVDRARSLKLGDGRKDGTDVGPLINGNSLTKVERYVDIGQAEGADLLTGGQRPSGKGMDNGFFFEPTIFARVRAGMRVEQEEIFGPVLSVIPAADEADAVRIANETIYGLNSAVFTADVERARAVAAEIRAGTVGHNGFKSDSNIGFGGFKQSGIGREGGSQGLLPFLESKTVLLDEPTARYADTEF
ncbi:MAG TPA: aldehyde dehydrogenase family protein, partial [Trebonia sp.]